MSHEQPVEAVQAPAPESAVLVGIDEKISVGRAALLGVQHVLAMDLYIVPIVLAGALAFGSADTSRLIQMTFLAAGIATLFQVFIGTRLPVVQGASYIPLGALAAIGGSLGPAAMFGSLIPGAVAITLLGYFKVLGRFIRRLVPPLVAGTVIVVIGIALMPVALNDIYAQAAHGAARSVIVSGSTAAMLVVFLMIGSSARKRLRYFKLASVVLALAGGTILASAYGIVDLSPVAKAPWFSLPNPFAFGVPQIDPGAAVTLFVVYLVVLVESTGTWYTVQAVTGAPLTPRVLNGGVGAEGLGCVVAPIIGGLPVTGYSTNAGVLAVTGVASKRAITAAAGLLVLLGLLPKLAALVASIPDVVVMGAFSIVTVIIAMNGIRVLKGVAMTERNMLVIGIPILLTIGATLAPKEVTSLFPPIIQYLIAGGMAVGAIAAVALNLILPGGRRAGEPAQAGTPSTRKAPRR